MNMNEILSFYEKIINNGLSNGSDPKTIEQSAVDFLEYLYKNDMVDFEEVEFDEYDQFKELVKATPLLLQINGCGAVVEKGILDFYQEIMKTKVANGDDAKSIEKTVKAFVNYLYIYYLTNSNQNEQLQALANATSLLLIMNSRRDLVNKQEKVNRSSVTSKTVKREFASSSSYSSSSIDSYDCHSRSHQSNKDHCGNSTNYSGCQKVLTSPSYCGSSTSSSGGRSC